MATKPKHFIGLFENPNGPGVLERRFNRGAPPHVGWWNSSVLLCVGGQERGLLNGWESCWRWWDGDGWSFPYFPTASAASIASYVLSCRYQTGCEIIWSDYYPEAARVPRVNPETGEVTGKA